MGYLKDGLGPQNRQRASSQLRDGSPRLARLVENFEQQLPKLLATMESSE